MPKQPPELLASPPLIFCPPPRRTYDCLTDGDTDCVEPRRSLDSTPATRPRRARPPIARPIAEGKSSSAAGSSVGNAEKLTNAPKLKRRVSTQKHSKQDLQTQASSEDFSATYWQTEELNESGEEPTSQLEMEVEEWVLDEEVPLHEALAQDLKRQGPAAMRAFRTAMKEGVQPLHSVKLCLVGHARAGKTSTLRSLSGRDFNPNQQSTHGVETKSCTLDKELWTPGKPGSEINGAWQELSEGLGSVAKLLEEKVAITVADTMKAQASLAAELQDASPSSPSVKGRSTGDALAEDTVLMIQRAISGEALAKRAEEVVVQTWDFAGQEMYYNMAHVFLTALGIYVLVLDLSAWLHATPVEKVESMDFWLAALLVHAKDAWLVIVGSHADAIEESMRQEVYDRLDFHLQKRLRHHNMLGNQEDGLLFFPVDNQQNTPQSLRSIQHLRREVSALASKVAQELGTIPTRWAHFFHRLEGLHEPCIALDRCRALAAELDMDGQQLELFLGLFHRLGQLLYFKGSPAVVLTPQWLLDAMAQVMACPAVLKTDPFRSKALRQEGLLQKDLLEVLWRDPKFQGQQRVLQSFLEHFDLLIPKGEDAWRVPSLLPRRPEKMIPLDAPVCVLLDFKGAFRRLLSTLIPRLLCQLEKRPVIAEIPFSEHWRSTRDTLLRGRKAENYEFYDRHGNRLSGVAEVPEVGFPLELRHRQEFKVHKIFRDYAKCTLSQTSSQTRETMVTFEVMEWQELMRVEVESHDAIVVKDVLDSLHVAICAWLPEVSYSTGLPCPCGVVQSGHLLELSKLLKEDSVFCDQKERSVEARPEEAKMIQQWRQLERGDCAEIPPGPKESRLPWSGSAAWHFMYASPLEYRQQRIPQLNVVQELDVLPNGPWQVAVCTPNALIETLQERPVVLHVTAHSSALPPKMGQGGDSRRALLLEDAFGSGSLLDVKQLLELGPWQDVGLLVLLTCYSKQLVEALNCRFAVCCIHQVRDAAAREFCRTFYRCLATHGAALDAFHAAQCAVRCSSDAGLRSEAENFHFVSRCSDLLDVRARSALANRPWVWPRTSRVEDFRCQVTQMVRMAKCLSNADGHRRVILLLGAPGAGKTATCREFCNHFSGPGRLFGGRVLFLQSQVLRGAANTAGGSMEDFLRQALTKISTTVQGQGLSLLVIDDLHIFQEVEKHELRLALEGALRLLESLRVLLTSRCALGGGWDSLEHSKIVLEELATLPSEDAAELFQRRCARQLYKEDFEAQPCNGTPRQALNVSSAHQLLLQSQLLKILDGVPGRIVGAAALVDSNLSSLLKHPALQPGNDETGTE